MEQGKKVFDGHIPTTLYAAVSGIVFIFLFSSSTSPFYGNNFGYDSAYYSILARGMLNGRLPYRDYFETIGPLFWLLQGVGELIGTHCAGIFVLQCVCAAIAASLVYRICLLCGVRGRKILPVFGVYYFVYASIMRWGGNTPEEFYLPLSLFCLYIALDYIRNGKLSVLSGAVFGFSMAAALLSDIRLGILPAALLVCMLYGFVKEKDFAVFRVPACSFAVGFMLLAFVCILPFVLQGALSQMISSLLLGAKVFETKGLLPYAPVTLAKLLPCAVVGIYCYVKYRTGGIEKEHKVLLVSCTAVCIGCCTRIPKIYCFITLLPLLVWLAVLAAGDLALLYEARVSSEDLRRRSLAPAAVLIGLIAVCGVYFPDFSTAYDTFFTHGIFRSGDQIYESYTELCSAIPQEERDSVYCMDSGVLFCAVNDILPANRYLYHGAYYSSMDKDMIGYCRSELKDPGISYLVTEDIGSYGDDDLVEYIKKNFSIVKRDYLCQIWKKR